MDPTDRNRVGIIGAGRLGQAMARTALRAGRPVVIAVPWGRVPEAVQGLEWSGQIVIDATNDFDPGDLDGRTSSELVAGLVGGARVVKAANTLGAAVLGADPHEAGGQRVIFLSGDDVDAKSEVVALFQDAGFFAIDLGDLATGGEMQILLAKSVVAYMGEWGPLSGVDS